MILVETKQARQDRFVLKHNYNEMQRHPKQLRQRIIEFYKSYITWSTVNSEKVL